MTDLERRQAALEKVAAKYRKRRVDFRSADCVRMLRYHLLQMGHRPPPLPRYQSMLGARRALEKAGGLVRVLDGLLPRIAPARMLPGDVAVIPGEGGDGGLIFHEFDKFIGCHQDEDRIVTLVVDLGVLTAAWRA
ncbi:DUF6950 family protein [Sphingobium sp.]|uniref:DUF6950 family protein n=1 Tax=Sphingobium sp. TaxID=1912891 RepID=UPI002E24EE8A